MGMLRDYQPAFLIRSCLYLAKHWSRPSASHPLLNVIIIGSGTAGGTLAHKLAPTGKKILILERGGYVPREKDNWRPRAVNL